MLNDNKSHNLSMVAMFASLIALVATACEQVAVITNPDNNYSTGSGGSGGQEVIAEGGNKNTTTSATTTSSTSSTGTGSVDHCLSNLDCGPSEEECRGKVCHLDDHHCYQANFKELSPCRCGVGICDAEGKCLAPNINTTVVCQDYTSSSSPTCHIQPECQFDLDCIDEKYQCVSSSCLQGYCSYQPLNNGMACKVDKIGSCFNGACCNITE